MIAPLASVHFVALAALEPQQDWSEGNLVFDRVLPFSDKDPKQTPCGPDILLYYQQL